jgi:hypothetical protein
MRRYKTNLNDVLCVSDIWRRIQRRSDSDGSRRDGDPKTQDLEVQASRELRRMIVPLNCIVQSSRRGRTYDQDTGFSVEAS